MKLSVFISIIAVFLLSVTGCGSSNAQKAVSEQTITAKVQKTFPKASIISSHKEERNGKELFAVETKEGEDRRSLYYSETGILVEMIQTMKPALLPPVIAKNVREQYPDGVVFMVLKTTRGKKVNYQLAVRSGKQIIEMNLDANGKPIER
jgi:uncharacterized membrane protein YkoI